MRKGHWLKRALVDIGWFLFLGVIVGLIIQGVK